MSQVEVNFLEGDDTCFMQMVFFNRGIVYDRQVPRNNVGATVEILCQEFFKVGFHSVIRFTGSPNVKDIAHSFVSRMLQPGMSLPTKIILEEHELQISSVDELIASVKPHLLKYNRVLYILIGRESILGEELSNKILSQSRQAKLECGFLDVDDILPLPLLKEHSVPNETKVSPNEMLAPVKKQSFLKTRMPCPTCSDVYFLSEDFKREHLKFHAGDDGFVCPYCGQAAGSWGEMYLHYCCHEESEIILGTQQRPRRSFLSCPYCARELVSRKSVLRHLKRIHMGQTGYDCEICSLKLDELSEFSRHMMFNHPNECPRYICRVCKFNTPNLAKYQAHLDLHKSRQNLTFKCPKCELQAISRTSYKLHRSICHIRSSPPRQKESTKNEKGYYLCKVCKYQYKSQAAVYRHAKKCHPKVEPTNKVSNQESGKKPSAKVVPFWLRKQDQFPLGNSNFYSRSQHPNQLLVATSKLSQQPTQLLNNTSMYDPGPNGFSQHHPRLRDTRSNMQFPKFDTVEDVPETSIQSENKQLSSNSPKIFSSTLNHLTTLLNNIEVGGHPEPIIQSSSPLQVSSLSPRQGRTSPAVESAGTNRPVVEISPRNTTLEDS